MSSCHRALSTGADRVQGVKESVWVEFIQLALEEKPLNLGQGFPDFAAPQHVTKALSEATLSSNILLNQYTRGFGHPRLVNALSTLYSSLINRTINPQTEVLVTVGAYEALFCAFLGHVNPGDEVIIVEPFFDCYEPMTIAAGGVPVFIPLRRKSPPPTNETSHSSADWILDPVELESKFSNKTKMIVINTPHNPLGKVFSRDELVFIGKLAEKYNALVLMDEVYEWIVFTGSQHVRLASIPQFWDRTITVGSAGKTFSVTGWKLGWAYGPAHLIKPMQLIHQNTVYTLPTPIQEAVAVAFEIEIGRKDGPDSYWKELSSMLEEKRNFMTRFMVEAGMNPTIPDGGYFMIGDISKLIPKVDLSAEAGDTTDHKFVRWMSKNKKLQGIPPSAFYGPADKELAANQIRFCYIKKDETLRQAEDILKNVTKSLSRL